MREKLRIDKEFRMLRQKYEVRSQLTSSQGTSSLAFSKSNNTFKLSNSNKNVMSMPPEEFKEDYRTGLPD